MRYLLILIALMGNFTSISANQFLKHRGVVYDVGLQYNEGSYSVDTFNVELVKYDMSIISNILRANTVRIEGEDISRLEKATEIAHAAGLKVFFNPWKMNAGEEETITYMTEAAKTAEKLRVKGVDLTFVAGCEYSLFCKGVFPGETFNERIAWLLSYANPEKQSDFFSEMQEKSRELNRILANICAGIRSNFTGQLTYSSGTWEPVNWDLFDMVGIDYYRDTQTDEEYVAGLDNYRQGKPLIVMEVGSCTYEGASQRGGFGFSILQGANPDGTGIYEGDVVPTRSEKEQADYIETQIRLLNNAGVDGVFIFLFSFPIMPYGEGAKDRDMTSYALVKTYAKDNARSQLMPPWAPKDAFYRLAEIYHQIEAKENR